MLWHNVVVDEKKQFGEWLKAWQEDQMSDDTNFVSHEDNLLDADESYENSYRRPSEREIAEQDRSLKRRWEEFQITARYVAEAFSKVVFVEKVVLFGSVAKPLPVEVLRFSKFRRWGVALSHECKDVDLAVWINDLNSLKCLFKARNDGLNKLREEAGLTPAHHQVDVFILEPGTDRYMGRLCCYNSCSKGKSECRVPNCGRLPFLRQHEEFDLDWNTVGENRALYERK
jgi:hypothetical protein